MRKMLRNKIIGILSLPFLALLFRKRVRNVETSVDKKVRREDEAHSEQHAQYAHIPTLRQDPTSNSANTSQTAHDTHQDKKISEPLRKEVREWLLTVFTGVLMVTTIFYAHYAAKQWEVSSEQRDLMGKQLNAMVAQSNTFNESLVESRKATNATQEIAGYSAGQLNVARQSISTAEKGVQTSAQSMILSTRAWVTISNVMLSQAFQNAEQTTCTVPF